MLADERGGPDQPLVLGQDPGRVQAVAGRVGSVLDCEERIITYIPTWDGFVYLATVLDCYSKRVIGYAVSDHMRTELVTSALEMAARNVVIVKGETVFHSDRGSQYTSEEMARAAARVGVVQSMGRTGVCWDNAWAESFNGTLKNELCNRKVDATKQQAIDDVTRWIEWVYGQKRIHSALGYQTPNEYEKAYLDSLVG